MQRWTMAGAAWLAFSAVLVGRAVLADGGVPASVNKAADRMSEESDTEVGTKSLAEETMPEAPPTHEAPPEPTELQQAAVFALLDRTHWDQYAWQLLDVPSTMLGTSVDFMTDLGRITGRLKAKGDDFAGTWKMCLHVDATLVTKNGKTVKLPEGLIVDGDYMNQKISRDLYEGGLRGSSWSDIVNRAQEKGRNFGYNERCDDRFKIGF